MYSQQVSRVYTWGRALINILGRCLVAVVHIKNSAESTSRRGEEDLRLDYGLCLDFLAQSVWKIFWTMIVKCFTSLLDSICL